MRIAVCSDLHLEFGHLELFNEQGADVLVLSGDIFVATELKSWLYDSSGLVAASESQRNKSKRYYNFIRSCIQRFPKVVFVMGNHEHYHGDFAESAKLIRGTFGDYHNFHFLDNEWVIINDVLFFGGTLWTNMNKEDPVTMFDIRTVMNDYRVIKNSEAGEGCRFIPLDAVNDHKQFLSKLDEALNLHPQLKAVVVGHHAPSKASTKPGYEGEYVINGAYSSDLSEFILDRRQIKVWTHGHTHEPFDYVIGTTRVVCNPRGYIDYEDCADWFELKYVDI
jgi:Icc-related predicted phosphoesterase